MHLRHAKRVRTIANAVVPRSPERERHRRRRGKARRAGAVA
jgi:hypothetical protein